MNSFIDYIKKQRKLIALIGIVLILGAGSYLKIIRPFKANNRQKSAEIESKKKIIEKTQTTISHKEALTQRFEYLTKKIQARLPVEREESQFLNELQRVAQENNIHIASMNPLPLKDLGSFKELSVEIDMEANLGNIVRFLYYMRKSSVVLVANRLRLEPKSERSALLKGI